MYTRFAAFLEQSPEREVAHFNPRSLAEYLNSDERATLKMLLVAGAEGIVNMHWDVRCPVCGSYDHRHEELGGLHHELQCAMCKAVYEPQLDVEVRVTFSPHERLRPLSARAFDPEFARQVDERLGPVPGMAVMALPEFQRHFPQQHLLPEESLKVTRLALLFTDLAGSTALYARRGDPRAYHLVRLHFDALFAVVDQSGGSVVKTIGDAILGVFQTPKEALDAAIRMQHAITQLNETRNLPPEECLILKVGVHSGPCLSVTLNGRPDFFGTTVNVAARVQGLSKGGDIVLSDAVYQDNEVLLAFKLADTPLVGECATLKGIDQEHRVYRLPMEQAYSV
jgi:class 3 adenylate cyclase